MDVFGEGTLDHLGCLDLSTSGIREIILRGEVAFRMLHTIHLEKNNLSHFSPLGQLPVLRILHLEQNEIKGLYPVNSRAVT